MTTEMHSEKFPSRLEKIIRFPLIRAVIAISMVVGAAATTQFLMNLLGSSLFAANEPPRWWSVLTLLLTIVATGLVYYAYVRKLEKRAVTELAWSGALKELGVGSAVGAGLFISVIFVLWLLGYYEVIGVGGLAIVIMPFFKALFAGVFEELLFRGIVFRIIEKSLGSWLALAFSALFFGFAHAANPNATIFSSAAIVLEAGILLAAAYLFTRRLWMAIGMHFAWNFTQSGIFGLAVSGNQARGLLQSKLTGPAFFSGGEFGAEASIFAVIICCMTGLYLLLKAYKKQHIIQPFWVSTH